MSEAAQRWEVSARLLVFIDENGQRWTVDDGFDFGFVMANAPGSPWECLLETVKAAQQ